MPHVLEWMERCLGRDPEDKKNDANEDGDGGLISVFVLSDTDVVISKPRTVHVF